MVRGALIVIAALVVGLGLRLGVDDAESAPTATTAPPATTAPATTAPVTTAAPTTTVPPTTAAPTTTEAPLVPEAELVVLVLNGGTGVAGAAGRLDATLEPFGYQRLEPANVNDGDVYDTSQVFHRAGLEREAARLAEQLGWPAESAAPLPDEPITPDDGGAQLLVVLGTDRAS